MPRVAAPRDVRLRLVGERIKERYANVTGCWVWKNVPASNGYCQTYLTREEPGALVHRVAYEFAKGPIPEGMTLDHTCGTRNCVNPSHLEPVSLRTNIARGYVRRGARMRIHDTDSSPITRRLRELGWSSYRGAKEAGVSSYVMRAAELGMSIRVSSALRIARALGATVEGLFGKEN